ncbi:ParA family protein [Deinococcus sp. RM]|uniref:ParA family protein n=1 Tax=Deinococcus sp. RM TaxID=2316359 RepID=UPI000E67BBF1|nr:ParA family protein [Deinococcus sp. RM]RIY15723.1 ParA family protein [Deinococcus sp. RM]
MMTYTFFNHAGGVGKTSATRDFGYELASRGHQVLLVDFDPQGNLTSFLGADKWGLNQDATLLAALLEDDPNAVQSRLPATVEVHGLSLYPATIDLAIAEAQLLAKIGRERRLSNILSHLPRAYDYVLIDSPPSLGTLTVNALVAADAVITPVATRFKAVDGLPGLTRMVNELQWVKPSLGFAAFLPTMYDQRNRHDSDVLDIIREQLAPLAPVLPPVRYRAADHNDASMSGQPVQVYKPGSEAARDMAQVVTAFLELKGQPA